MARPNLLLCFDAFGTLFRPKAPVALQYSQVARECGITGFRDDELQARLFAAIKDERAQNPNYGKATGLGATKWWENVIRKTFTPLLTNNQSLPIDLAPKLLGRFSSQEGYTTEHNLIPNLKSLKQQHPQTRFNKIAIGVITNSDNRVPIILSSFGLNVSPLRYSPVLELPDAPSEEEQYDIDFHCMSYDVGIEKPDRRIFQAADVMLSRVIASRGQGKQAGREDGIESWQRVYIGDEYDKDVVGAMNADWNPVLLDVDGNTASDEIPSIDESTAETIVGLFKKHAVVKVRSIQDLVRWLTNGR